MFILNLFLNWYFFKCFKLYKLFFISVTLIFIMSCDNKINEKTYFSGKILKKTNDKISLIKNENIIKETSISISW